LTTDNLHPKPRSKHARQLAPLVLKNCNTVGDRAECSDDMANPDVPHVIIEAL